MLLADVMPLKATPTSAPVVSKTGPPLLPGLMAASICTHRLSVRPPTRMRETTPRVALTSSPPMGKPTATTSEARRGMLVRIATSAESSSEACPSPCPSPCSSSAQKSASCTMRSARSRSWAMHTTLATYFSAAPARRTWMSEWFSTTCAFVITHLASAAASRASRWSVSPGCSGGSRARKPEPVERVSSPRIHGIA
jgi:hypothetical protein